MDVLQKQPNLPVIITDNEAQAKELLLSLGILNHFKPAPEQTKTTQSHVLMTHPTHWVVASLLLGNADAVENGYLVICLPKSTLTPQQFIHAANQMLHEQGFVDTAKFFADSSDSPGSRSEN